MILAALIDLGMDAEVLQQQAASLGIEPFEIRARPFSDGGMRGTQVTVTVAEDRHLPHRRLNDIRNIIEASDLADGIKQAAVSIFARLAAAEAAVHDTTPDEIHFHEVGALDAIVDIVGACTAIDSLGIDRVEVGPLPVGRGTVECRHGVMPVPVPATVELLGGHPVVATDEPHELVTPTGAAILMHWAQTTRDADARAGAAASAPRSATRHGLGFGHRRLRGRLNALRTWIGEADDTAGRASDTCLVLECNIDDTVPELLGSLLARLMEHGALDAFTTPVQMKKQRPGTLLTVLARPADRETLLDAVFRETTTFGIRERCVERVVLDRRHVEVNTPYGMVRVKIGTWQNADITHAPEHDDCVRCAKAENVSVRAVYEAALRAALPPPST
jgi:uncharacterized protein (TIGR00299 family) protein